MPRSALRPLSADLQSEIETGRIAYVADLVGQARCLYYDVPEESLREIRGLIAFRSKLKKQEHALRMRLRNNLFAQYFPELDQIYIRAGQPDDIPLKVLPVGVVA